MLSNLKFKNFQKTAESAQFSEISKKKNSIFKNSNFQKKKLTKNFKIFCQKFFFRKYVGIIERACFPLMAEFVPNTGC